MLKKYIFFLLISLLIISCSKNKKAENPKFFYLVDKQHNKVSNTIKYTQKIYAIYKPYGKIKSQVSFQLLYLNKEKIWEILSNAMMQPETPKEEIVYNLHSDELMPGKYRIILFVSNKQMDYIDFEIK